MKKLRALAFLLVAFAFSLVATFSTAALAQQFGANANDRVAQQLGQFFMQLQVQQDQIANLQAQLQAAREETKRLKDKYEPPEKPEK